MEKVKITMRFIVFFLTGFFAVLILIPRARASVYGSQPYIYSNIASVSGIISQCVARPDFSSPSSTLYLALEVADTGNTPYVVSNSYVEPFTDSNCSNSAGSTEAFDQAYDKTGNAISNPLVTNYVGRLTLRLSGNQVWNSADYYLIHIATGDASRSINLNTDINGKIFYRMTDDLLSPLINPSVTSDVSTSTLQIADINSTSSPFYIDCSAYDNVGLFSSGTIGGFWCNAKKQVMSVSQWLLVPPTYVSQYWYDSLNSVKSVPPFSIAFSAVNSFEQSANLVATSTPDYSALHITIPEAHINSDLLQADMLKNWLTNADCDATCAQGKKDTYFNYATAIIWVASGLKVLTLIF